MAGVALVMGLPMLGYAQSEAVDEGGIEEQEEPPQKQASPLDAYGAFSLDALGMEEEEQRRMEGFDTVRIRALDKITARTETTELRIGDMMDFGALTITARACRKSAPIDQPESAAFLQVWEFPIGSASKDDIEEAQIRFSGWMFASSPGLSAMDHPIYDIWVLDCVGESVSKQDQELQDIELDGIQTTPRDGGGALDMDAIQTETLSEGTTLSD